MNLRPVLFVMTSLACAGGALAAACVIADPAPEVPVPPPHRPTILHGSVVPPDMTILSQFPTSFVVPVDLVDPSQAFQYNVFVDQISVFSGRVEPDPSLTDAGVRVVEVSLDPPNAAFCHVVDFVVALTFNGASANTPNPPGGDDVVWFYDPSGSGCPLYDAGGLDGAFPPPDAGVDAPSDSEGGE